MTFRIDKTKKKEFGKASFLHTVKLFLPIFCIVFPIMLAFMTIQFLKVGMPLGIVAVTIAVSAICIVAGVLLSLWLGTLSVRRGFDSWELTVEDTYAVLKNNFATTTVHFSSIKRAKGTPTCVIYYVGLFKRFYVDWQLFEHPTELKNCLDSITVRIGTFQKSAETNEPKTGVVLSRKQKIIYALIIIVAIAVHVLNRFLK